MPHHLRYQSQTWATHHITSRCLQGFAFLKPTKEINAIISGVLCYSLNSYKQVIELHHYAFLSNHFHLLISAAKTEHMSKFLGHFKGNLARELGRVHDWHGTLWQKRFSNEEILDEGGLEEIFKYITQNSVKEGLVDHPSQWSGVHGFHQLVEGKNLVGDWLNRTKLYVARKRANARGNVVNEWDYTTEYKASLTAPPMWCDDSEEEYRARCQRLCDTAIEEALANREKPAMGMAKVMGQETYKARFTKRSSRPLCRTKCIERLKAFKEAYYAFKAQFQEASATLREAIANGVESICVRFPEGGVPLFGGCSYESAI